MGKLLTWALRAGMRKGWQRGIRDGNSTWLVVGGAALVGHLGRKHLRREEEVVFSEQLKPGETFRIVHEQPR